MSILDDNLLDVADEAARIALEWEKEDDDFQRQHPESLIYKWFSQHSTSWLCERQGEWDPLTLTQLEIQTGRRHLQYTCGKPVYMMTFFAPIGNSFMIDAPTVYHHTVPVALSIYSKTIQLDTYKCRMDSQIESNEFILRVPPIIDLHDVTEWPDWICLFRNITFWIEDSCMEPPKGVLNKVWWCKDYDIKFTLSH